MTKFRKALLFTLCLIPFAAVGGWFTAQMSIASVDEEALANAIQQVGSKEMVMLLTTLQTVIYAVICGFFGYIVADKIGLIRPFQLAKKDTLITLLAGAICGIIVSADAFTFANWIPELADSYENSKSFDTPTWIASILYGGVIEEVMMRLFFMSLIALIGWKLFCKKEDAVPEKILVVSNITAAALFAAAHLPSTAQIIGHLTPMLIFRSFLMNGAFGILFGRLYRKYGIQYAMLVHMLAHIVSRTIWLIIL